MAVLLCPSCGRPLDSERSPAAPFCSQRCQQVDLYRWLNEEHGLPVDRDEPPAQDGASRNGEES